MYITGKFNQTDAEKFIAGQKEYFLMVDMTGQKYVFAHGSSDGKIASAARMQMNNAQFIGCFAGMVAQNGVNVMPELQNVFNEIHFAVVNTDTIHIIA